MLLYPSSVDYDYVDRRTISRHISRLINGIFSQFYVKYITAQVLKRRNRNVDLPRANINILIQISYRSLISLKSPSFEIGFQSLVQIKFEKNRSLNAPEVCHRQY